MTKARKPADLGNDRYAVRMKGPYLIEVRLKHELDLMAAEQRVIDLCDHYEP